MVTHNLRHLLPMHFAGAKMRKVGYETAGWRERDQQEARNEAAMTGTKPRGNTRKAFRKQNLHHVLSDQMWTRGQQRIRVTPRVLSNQMSDFSCWRKQKKYRKLSEQTGRGSV